MQTQCAVFFSFFRLSAQGLYSVTVISGLALMTFSLSRLWDEMQKTATRHTPQKAFAADAQKNMVLHTSVFCPTDQKP